jgi:integrase
MASLHKDPRNKSPYWYCAYTLPDGRRAFRSTKQRDRKKALDVARTLEKAAEKARAGELTEAQVRKLLDGILESVGQSPIRSETVRSFFNTWLSGKKLSTSPSTHALYNRCLTKFLGALSLKADRPLSGVTPADVAVFRDSRSKEDHVSGGTLGLDLRVIRSVFSSARRQGLILHNPAEAIDLPTNKPLERDVFTPAELSALLAVASPEWRTLILCGYYLGGRLSDMASLSWNSVDLAGGVISYTQGKTGRKVVVPIHLRLEQELLSIAATDQHGPLCPRLAKTRANGRRGLSNQFAKLVQQAGIDPGEVCSNKNRFSRKSFHSLRHSFSSALANAGVANELRMKLTGHRSMQIHQRYSHIELETLRTAIGALPRLSEPDLET